MNIAVVTLTYNDGYKFKEWLDHYNEYKDEIYKHIVVDNNSTQKYKEILKNNFTDSTIIFRETNGGCTGAYNDGIEYALSLDEIDYIALVGNDIRISKGSLTNLVDILTKNNKLGMVSPALLYKNSESIEDFGCTTSHSLSMQEHFVGYDYNKIPLEVNYCDSVPGGMNMASRQFYERVGLQDNKMFMYSDEVEMGIRAKRKGFKIAAVSTAKAWHQHINENKTSNRRHPFSKYLAGRNKVYVAKKHFGLGRIMYVFCYFFFGAFARVFQNILKGNFNRVKEYLWMAYGAINGLVGNMNPNKYSQPIQQNL